MILYGEIRCWSLLRVKVLKVFLVCQVIDKGVKTAVT